MCIYVTTRAHWCASWPSSGCFLQKGMLWLLLVLSSVEDWAKNLHSKTPSHWLMLQHVLLSPLVEVTKDFSDNIISTAFRNLWQEFNLQIHKTQRAFLTFIGNFDSCKIKFTSGRVSVGENHTKKKSWLLPRQQVPSDWAVAQLI